MISVASSGYIIVRAISVCICVSVVSDLSVLRLSAIVQERFEKLVGMGPEVIASPSKGKSILQDLDRKALRMQLSPMSSGKAHQLEAPSKKGLVDFDKGMTSQAASVKKGLSVLRDHVDKMQKEKAKEQARQDRIAKEQAKRESKKAKMLQKAREEGDELAGKELAAEDPAEDEDDGNDQDEAEEDADAVWTLVKSAKEFFEKGKSFGNVSTLAMLVPVLLFKY